MEKEEKKLTYEDLVDLMGKIEIEIGKSKGRQESIDHMTEELYEETRPMMVEKRKAEIEEAKQEKAEFDEMTKNALVNAKKQILQIREESEKEYQDFLVKTAKKQTDIKRKLSSIKKDFVDKDQLDKIAIAEEKANNALDKVNNEMKDFQDKHFELRKQLEDNEKNIWDYAVEIGVEKEIDSVTLEDKKIEPIKVKPTKVKPARVEPTKVEPVKVEPTKVGTTKVGPTKVEPVKVGTTKVGPTKVEPVKVEPVKVGTTKVGPTKVEPTKVGTVKQEPKKSELPKIAQIKIEPWKHQMEIVLDNGSRAKVPTITEYLDKNDDVNKILEDVKINLSEEFNLDKNSKKMDPNILIALQQSKNEDVLYKYVKAVCGKNKEELPFNLQYDLEGTSYLEKEERKNIKKITRRAKKLGATVNKEKIMNRIKAMLISSKQLLLSEKNETEKEEKADIEETRDSNSLVDKLKERLKVKEKYQPKHSKSNDTIISKTKSLAVSLGNQTIGGLKIVGTKLSGYFRGENELVTKNKIRNIRETNFVQKATINEQAAVNKVKSSVGNGKHAREEQSK